MSLSNDYPATAIAGIFGAVQEKRAAKEAIRILNEAKTTAMNRSNELSAMFKPFVDQSGKYLTQAGQAVDASQQYLMDQAGQIEVGQGLTAADEIAYKDAARLLSEQMVKTGNLRSGAAAFGQTELLRRVVADANQRNFDRRIAKLQTIYGGMAQGASQYGQIGSVSGQIGLQGQSLANQLLQTALGFSTQLSGAEIRKGQALSNEIVSYGVATDEVAHTVIDAFKAAGSMGASEMMGDGGASAKSTGTGLTSFNQGGSNFLVNTPK